MMASYYTRLKVPRTSEVEPSEYSDVEPGDAAPSAAATSLSTIVRPTVAAVEESESMATERLSPCPPTPLQRPRLKHTWPRGTSPTSLGGPGVEGPEDSSLVAVSALGYPNGQAGPSEITVCSDVQVSPYSLAMGIADTRTHLEASSSSSPTPTSSLRQPPVAATETAAAQGLTLAPYVVVTPTRGTRRAPSVPARPSSTLRSLSPPVLSPAYGLEQPESVHHRTGELLCSVMRRRVLGCSVRLACRRVRVRLATGHQAPR